MADINQDALDLACALAKAMRQIEDLELQRDRLRVQLGQMADQYDKYKRLWAKSNG